MARGRKTGGRDWTKGNAPKSPGRPRIPKEQKEALRTLQKLRSAKRLEYTEIINTMLELKTGELSQKIQEGYGESARLRSDVAIKELLVGKVILKNLKNGKIEEFATLLDLLCGPEPKHLELSVSEIPDEELLPEITRRLENGSKNQSDL